jgi:hypothetical protein
LTPTAWGVARQEIERSCDTLLFAPKHRGTEPSAVSHCVIRSAWLIQTDLSHLRNENIAILRGQGGRVAAGVMIDAVPLLTDADSAWVARKTDLKLQDESLASHRQGRPSAAEREEADPNAPGASMKLVSRARRPRRPAAQPLIVGLPPRRP